MKTESTIVVTIILILIINPCIHATNQMDWAIIGDAGNSSDYTGIGSVGYEYMIGKYEVTNGQYRAFLNAVAVTDTYGVYSSSGYFGDGGMGGPYGGITRNGSPGNYTYTPKNGDSAWDSKPVNFVSWFNCLRFANWLNNGQPFGIQDATSTEDGAYDLSLGAYAIRKLEAKVFLPNENEWYKAAYYKGDNTNAGYWSYATQSNTCPNSQSPLGNNNSANYDDVMGSPYHSSDVGAYVSASSSYGTFDQNGNIMEWSETKSCESLGQFYCHGGCWYFGSNYLPAAFNAADAIPTGEYNYLGFRVASVPEPATLLLLGLGGLMLRRKKK